MDMTKIRAWLMQPTTIHGLGVLAATGIGLLTQYLTHSMTADAAAMGFIYAAVHLGCKDNSALEKPLDALARDAIQAAMQGQLQARFPELFKGGVAVAEAAIPVAPQSGVQPQVPAGPAGQ